MTQVFINVVWKGSPLKPYVLSSDIDSIDVNLTPLTIGNRIDMKFLEGKYCVGTEIGKGQWITCTKNHMNLGLDDINTKPILLGKQCGECVSSNFFDCRMTCMGNFCAPSSLRAKQYCDPPNTKVYLTHIAGIYKVGVSLGLPRRWIEQGSEFAVHIATAPGLEARRIEQMIARKLELALQIRNKTKMDDLNQINENVIVEELRSLAELSGPIIDEVLSTCEGEKIENPQIIDLSNYYGNKIFANKFSNVEPEPNEEFGGEIIAVQGSILVVQAGEYKIGLDLKRLIGSEFQLLDRPAKQNIQTNVSDWF